MEVGPDQGLPERVVINCDNLVTIRKRRLDPRRVGRLGPVERVAVDRALRYSVDIIY